MKKLIIVYIALIIAVVLLAVFKFGGAVTLPSIPFLGGGSKVIVNNQTFKVDLAKSEKDKIKGLSGRKSHAQDKGMLFLFDSKDKYGFWMKDMQFPIDIIWLDDNKVVYIVKNAPSAGQTPNLTIYRPDKPANRVLEINAGLSDKYNITEGTTVTYKSVK